MSATITRLAHRAVRAGKAQPLLRADGLPAAMAGAKIVGFHGTEELSGLFDFYVEIALAPATLADADGLLSQALGANVSIALALDGAAGKERWFNGRVASAQIAEVGGAKVRPHVVARLRPALWWLSLEWDTRLYTDKTAQEIIDDLLTGRVEYDWRLSPGRSFDRRPFCRQYRETTLHFFHRLMEDEGVHYWIEFSQGMHRLVLSDDPAKLPACPRPGPVGMGGADDQARVSRRMDRVFFLQRNTQVQPASYRMEARDQADPFASFEGSSKHACAASGDVFDPTAAAASIDGLNRTAELRLKALVARGATIHGNGDVRDFGAAQSVAIAESGGVQRYRLTTVRFEAVQDETVRYRNHFEAVPAAAPFAPQRLHARPIMGGLEQAEVLSKPDKHGRVEVCFDLDRRHNASARVPVGHGHDIWFVPRPGQRVLVDHVEGDPDRPVIIKSIDDDATLPMDPEWHPRRGGITTPHHRLWFEDASQEKHVWMEVDGDFSQAIAGDSDTKVEKDVHLHVGGDCRQKITGTSYHRTEKDAHNHVGGLFMERVMGDRYERTEKDAHTRVAGSWLATVGKELGINVGQDLVLSAGQRIVLRVGDNGIVIDNNGVLIFGTKVRLNPPIFTPFPAPTPPKPAEPVDPNVKERKPPKRKRGR